jgi:hypothetical protein
VNRARDGGEASETAASARHSLLQAYMLFVDGLNKPQRLEIEFEKDIFRFGSKGSITSNR